MLIIASTQALVSGNQDLKLTVIDAYTLELSGPKGFTDNMSRDIFLLRNVFPDEVAAAALERGITFPE